MLILLLSLPCVLLRHLREASKMDVAGGSCLATQSPRGRVMFRARVKVRVKAEQEQERKGERQEPH